MMTVKWRQGDSGKLYAAFVPPPLVFFSGAMGVVLTNARAIDDADGRRVWGILENRECQLTVVVETGRGPQLKGPASLASIRGRRAWEPLDVRRGTQADSVELDLVVDAPFLAVSNARGHFECPTTDGAVTHESKVRAQQTGPFDLRVVLLSAGRVIQAVSLEIVVTENR